jgi:hypothetical protein
MLTRQRSGIGHFATAGHAVAKGIFLGGVTRRFPQLRFAFLEGGVGWASQLFGDLIEHWERRNAKALERMNPTRLDRKLLMELVEKYGYDDMAEALQARDGYPNPEAHLTGGREELDGFAACKIAAKEEDRALRQALPSRPYRARAHPPPRGLTFTRLRFSAALIKLISMISHGLSDGQYDDPKS